MTTPGANSPVLADVNNDGKLDLVSGSIASTTAYVYLGTGAGTFQAAITFINTGVGSLATADFNGDGNLDVVSGDQSGSAVYVTFGNGNGTFGNQLSLTNANSQSAVVTSDFNGDGKIDFITADSASNTLSVRLGNGNGTFTSRTTIRTETNLKTSSMRISTEMESSTCLRQIHSTALSESF